MNERRWLFLLITVYVVLAVAYSWVMPLGESPDEVDHFLYVHYLVENREFPVMHPDSAENETMEANQPPLFYLLNAAVTAPLPRAATADFPLNACFTFDPLDGGRAHFYLHQSAEQTALSADYLAFRAARLVSVVLGALTIWLAYRLGRRVTLGGRHVGLLAAGILAFTPQFIFMTASVNNDVLTAVLGAALVYFTVEAVDAPSLARFVGLGVLMGLGLLTKFALLAFWPLPLLAILLTANKGQKKQSGLYVAVVLGLSLLVAGWWYYRAYLLYGDPLAWDVHLQAKGAEVLRTAPLTLADLREFVVIHFQSYWAWFGWLKIKAAGWVYAVLALGVLVASLGLLLWGREAVGTLKAAGLYQWRTWLRENMGVTAVLLSILATAAIYASLFRYIQTINWSGYQGRLAYAAVAPIAALLAAGWWRMTIFSGQKWIGFLPVSGLLVFALASLVQLNAAFARPALYQPPSGWARVCQTTSGNFYIEAVDFPKTVRPGDSLTVSIAGYGQQAEDRLIGEFALLNWDGSLLDTAVTPLLSSAQVPVLTTARLTVPPDALPAAARLAFMADNQTIELGQLKIAAGPTAVPIPTPTNTLTVNFADQIALLGYDLQTEAGGLRLTTYWQALQPMEENYTIFVHVLDERGDLIAQQDAPPQGGRYPTSIWDAGEVVSDEAILTLSPDAQPAQIAVGMYRLDTLGRLPLVGEVVDDTAVGQVDHLLIPIKE